MVARVLDTIGLHTWRDKAVVENASMNAMIEHVTADVNECESEVIEHVTEHQNASDDLEHWNANERAHETARAAAADTAAVVNARESLNLVVPRREFRASSSTVVPVPDLPRFNTLQGRCIGLTTTSQSVWM